MLWSTPNSFHGFLLAYILIVRYYEDMATRLLEKGQIVKVGSVPHKLLGDVEAETATTEAVVSELAKKASKARWEKRSKEERSAHARVMLKARWSKSTVDPLKSQEMPSRAAHVRGTDLTPAKITPKAPPIDTPPKSAVTEPASPRVSPPAENARKNCMAAPETPENLHETCDNSEIDWTKTDFQIAQATGKSVPAVKKLREQQVKP